MMPVKRQEAKEVREPREDQIPGKVPIDESAAEVKAAKQDDKSERAREDDWIQRVAQAQPV
jgi:hypothetical protein